MKSKIREKILNFTINFKIVNFFSKTVCFKSFVFFIGTGKFFLAVYGSMFCAQDS